MIALLFFLFLFVAFLFEIVLFVHAASNERVEDRKLAYLLVVIALTGLSLGIAGEAVLS